MADVTLMGTTYSDVPAVDLPSANGTVRFYDMNELTYVESVNGNSGVVTLDIPPTMTILSYGSSTWDDFITAYNSNSVVYCRASSNSNPASGAQTRMAFMAYVNNETAPTNVEFQYYRSVSSHTATQQGDQVFIYKLDKTNGWSVTTREAMSKIAAGSNMSSSYSSGTLTLNADSQLPSVTSSDNGKVLAVENGAWSSEELLVPVANGGTGADNAPDALENLGAVPLAGGTMTGNLLVDNYRVKTLSSSIERGNPGSGDIYGGGTGFEVCDKDGKQIGYIQPVQYSNGRETMQMGVSSYGGSSTNYNSIEVGFDANGNMIYGVSSASAFRNALGASSGIWPVSLGGTGATTAAGALANLGVLDLVIAEKYNETKSAYSGGVSFTHNAPSGYKLLVTAPLAMYASGDATVYPTDRGASQNGSTVTVTAFIYNPNNASVSIAYQLLYIRA